MEDKKNLLTWFQIGQPQKRNIMQLLLVGKVTKKKIAITF